MEKWVVLRVTLLAAALAVALVPIPAAWVEQAYSQRLYPFLQRLVTTVSNLAPVSLLDVLLLGTIGCVSWRVWHLVRTPRGRRLRIGRSALADFLAGAAAVYLVFIGAWGCNYRRQPLTEKLDYRAERVTAASLAALARDSVDQLNSLHASAHQSGWPPFDRLSDAIEPSFRRLDRFLGRAAPTVLGRPKPTLLAWYFRSAAFDGMTDPFFLETLVNPEVLPYERPFLVAHEWAHLAGYADEGEANFLAWLVCREGNEATQYSAWLFLGPHLWRAMPEEVRRDVTNALGPGPRDDLSAIRTRMSGARPLVSRYARDVYDRFLRAHRVAEGVRSYDAVVRLVLGVRTGGYPPD